MGKARRDGRWINILLALLLLAGAVMTVHEGVAALQRRPSARRGGNARRGAGKAPLRRGRYIGYIQHPLRIRGRRGKLRGHGAHRFRGRIPRPAGGRRDRRILCRQRAAKQRRFRVARRWGRLALRAQLRPGGGPACPGRYRRGAGLETAAGAKAVKHTSLKRQMPEGDGPSGVKFCAGNAKRP